MTTSANNTIKLWVAGIAAAGVVIAAIVTGLLGGFNGIGGDSINQHGDSNEACVHSTCPRGSK